MLTRLRDTYCRWRYRLELIYWRWWWRRRLRRMAKGALRASWAMDSFEECYPIDQGEVSPPMHPPCRCWIVPVDPACFAEKEPRLTNPTETLH